jgi:serine/threonine protein kinase
VARLARGLAAAHAQGIVHHDVAPRNVIVRADGRPVLVGLGLSWLGLAPGQAGGEAERIDLFGLGGVLYFLLTGQAPAGGHDAAALDRPDVPRRLAEQGTLGGIMTTGQGRSKPLLELSWTNS